MRKILAGILVSGLFTGIIPILFGIFLSRHIKLLIVLAILMLIWLKKELCEE